MIYEISDAGKHVKRELCFMARKRLDTRGQKPGASYHNTLKNQNPSNNSNIKSNHGNQVVAHVGCVKHLFPN